MAVKKQFSFLLPGFLLHAVTCCLSRAFHIKYFFVLCVGVAVIGLHTTLWALVWVVFWVQAYFLVVLQCGPLDCLNTRYMGLCWWSVGVGVGECIPLRCVDL